MGHIKDKDTLDWDNQLKYPWTDKMVGYTNDHSIPNVGSLAVKGNIELKWCLLARPYCRIRTLDYRRTV